VTETGNDVVVATAESAAQRLGAKGAQAGEPPPLRARHEPSSPWVDAAPFRAHLRHLMSVGELDVPEVAVVLGLSTQAVRHLLDGRRTGRVPRRISPRTARRLLLVRTDDVRGLRWCLAPTGAARSALRRLRSEGWSAAEVAAGVGVGLGELGALEQQTHCSRLLAVRLVGLARRLPSTLDDEDLLDVPAAA
jgi:hypothetical protein